MIAPQPGFRTSTQSIPRRDRDGWRPWLTKGMRRRPRQPTTRPAVAGPDRSNARHRLRLQCDPDYWQTGHARGLRCFAIDPRSRLNANRLLGLIEKAQIGKSAGQCLNVAEFLHQLHDLLHRAGIANGIHVRTIKAKSASNDIGMDANKWRTNRR